MLNRLMSMKYTKAKRKMIKNKAFHSKELLQFKI